MVETVETLFEYGLWSGLKWNTLTERGDIFQRRTRIVGNFVTLFYKQVKRECNSVYPCHFGNRAAPFSASSASGMASTFSVRV